jgi:4-aminobutyrate aminotransferase-like enzyme/Ser/Thr protein kinase RdoA (MazF antagonist)
MFLEERTAAAVSPEEAERFAIERYGVAGVATALPGEYDCNFHLRASDGRALVLKCMHPAREASFIAMQCAALAHLREKAPHLPLPRVQSTQQGLPFTEVSDCAGQRRLLWMLNFLPGATLAQAHPRSSDLLRDLGGFLGELDLALETFRHPAVHRELKWDLSRAGWIQGELYNIAEPSRRELLEYFLSLYVQEVESRRSALRAGPIYGDANDHNVLVTPPWPEPRKVAGVIDFGDMHYGWIVSEPAIAAAYALLGRHDALGAVSDIVRGFHRAFRLTEPEIAALFPLVGMRLAVSVVNSAARKKQKPGDPYVTVTENQAWVALERLRRVHPRLAHYAVRDACGLTAVPKAGEVTAFLKQQGDSGSRVVEADLRTAPLCVFDLSAGSTFLGADPGNAETHTLTRSIFERMEGERVTIGIGRYNEARLLYSASQYAEDQAHPTERRTIHLGIDLFVVPGSVVTAPIEGVVYLLAENTAELDYGPLVVLRHETAAGKEFFTLYGHLSRATLGALKPGRAIARGERFASVGTAHENGGWPPHLHFQIILDLLERGAEFPGVARASERSIWTGLSPDPNLLLGIPMENGAPVEATPEEVMPRRRELLGGNLSVSYRRPLKIVRGWRQHLYDQTGRAYLDVYNNVPLLGHCHPRVVRAVQEQLALLNTNTRYLHENILRYAEALTRLLPDPLRVCYIVNSGSEANELALRMARATTQCDDAIVLEHAYHGHTNTLIDISPYKFDGPGGNGKKPWVHVAPLPDDYRGPYRRGESDLGAKYAARVGEICRALKSKGRRPTYIAESLPSVGGQIVFPPNYLAEVYRHVHSAGGVAIADEVQVGFGRLGTHFWGFETQGVVPDIVVLGKPIGNAFPLAAVITTREIARAFDNGMEFFSTFGGNPVSCAAGLAVLDVLQEQCLQANASRIGRILCDELERLEQRHPLIGDVRGSGLFLGLDLVRSRETRQAAPDQASYVANRLREEGILTGTDGPHHNVIKLRPPLIFSESDAAYFCAALEQILCEDPARPA